MDWEKFLKNFALTLAVTAGKEIVKTVYLANKEAIDRRIAELIKVDPFAIEIQKNEGYL